ncbi:MAG: secondary thiamine-phosphate synthase enzyme YjbQ [Candidatus Omnitrophica bacterium]|jgi:secondary thiamine-phosphate synthase enzyme|nr:secondary thiamine-phosphate synthase enzyme YjbQ [Candidatus Omnitrophota bacterium]MDD5080001.1 secondary thiamine-phosphate synthase enzyme YjbQ [Candidatus Omnitrophota bacterium]
MEKIEIKTKNRMEFVDITEKIRGIAEKCAVPDGLCVLFCPHTTAGLTINENADPAVKEDMLAAFTKLVPLSGGYTHSEGNSDSHIKSSIFGQSLSIIVENRQLMLGAWQGIYFCESDGPRLRELWVKFISG